MMGSCHTTPVNDSFGCRRVGTEPLGLMSIALLQFLYCDDIGLPKTKKGPASLPGLFVSDVARGYCACWIAESSQFPPRARVKVHTSVASCGASVPSAALPVARST